MQPSKFGFIRSLHPFVIFGVLAVIYLLLVLFLPANKASMAQHGWTPGEYHLFYLLVLIPLVATWFATYYGYNRVRLYAQSIAHTPDGKGYDRLATGLGWLAISLPLPSIAGLLLNSIANENQDFLPAAIIIVTYLTLLLPFIGFVIIGDAARHLISKANIHLSLAGARSVILFFVFIGVLFCYFVLRNFDLANANSSDNPYFLPIWVMLITLIVPYLYAWFVGLLAAYEFTVLASKAHGLLYAQALRLVAFGLTIVIASSIILEYLDLAAPRSGHLELDSRLFAFYLFRIAAGAGFLVIAHGANKLRKIEEV